MPNHRSTERVVRAALATAIGLAVALSLTGCFARTDTGATDSGSASRQAAPPTDLVAGAPAPMAGGQSASAEKGATPGSDKLVVVTKTLQMRVDSVNAAVDKIRALTRSVGGDITSLQVSTISDDQVFPTEPDPVQPMGAERGTGTTVGSGPLKASVTIRVPAKAFPSFVDSVAKLGRVLVQSENSEDVTQQHVDMAARLRNLVAEERRFRQFLAKARTVREALEVERELERVRGEIESLRAQLDYLERQAAMATITLDLSEPRPIVRPVGIDWGVGRAVTTGIQGLVGLVNLLIVAVIATAPIWIPGLVVCLVIVALVRRRRRRRSAQTDQESEQPVESPEE